MDEQELLKHYIGKKVGNWTVVALVGRNSSMSRIWLCRCACGQERTFLTASLSGNGKKSATECMKCLRRRMDESRQEVDEVPHWLWTKLVQQAARRGLTVSITRDEASSLYRQQGGRCALSGVPIQFLRLRKSTRLTTTASLDRIDSRLPYTRDNVQWVHKIINMMKWKLTDEEFRSWCCLVAARQGEDEFAAARDEDHQ